jgi:glycine/serine hydroxymethyltransferase
MRDAPPSQVDPDVFNAMESELSSAAVAAEMIASENFAP